MAAWLLPLVGAALLWLLLPRRRGDAQARSEAAAARAAIAAARDPTPFGEALARRLWRAVRRAEYGLIPHGHRDYCGHGLVACGDGIGLYRIQDGWTAGQPPFAQWDTEQAFVAFWARQSNNSVNGHDPAEPVFFTEDDWDRGNQRLIRQVLERCLEAMEAAPEGNRAVKFPRPD